MKFARKTRKRPRVLRICRSSVLLAERDAASAEMALTELGDATFGDNQTQLTAAFGRGLLARMMKDESKGTRRVCRDSSRTGEDRTGAAGFRPRSMRSGVD